MNVSKRIGICTPYTWDEATYMACILADLAMRLGIPVSILSSQAHETRIHYRWDREVTSGRRRNFLSWALQCSHLVWFDIQKNKLIEAKQLPVKNILVVLWQRLKQEDIGHLSLFDAVVCPHQAAQDLLKEHGWSSSSVIPWDSGMPIVETPLTFDGNRIFVPLTSVTADKLGSVLFHAFRVLLDGNDKLYVTFSHVRSFDRPTLTGLQVLAAKHPDKVVVARKINYAEREEAYATHDWIFVPDVQANVGLSALEGLAAGRPILAFNIPPFTEFLHSDNSVLISCGTKENALGAIEADLNAFELQEKFDQTFTDSRLCSQLCESPRTDLLERRYSFQQGWRRLWDYDSPE